MLTIYKYALAILSQQPIRMPKGAKILSVDCQRDTICLWAEVDCKQSEEVRWIGIVGTGRRVPEGDRRFIGTVQQRQFVWHVYELTNLGLEG